ncbi:serine hydrolase [Alkalinema pantanalense CENA528]|uniref:serine hydrolase n=1 Tax=Alkalinema pantanalense TaxID=1620705 RepID=UPI003D6FEB24
MRYRFVLLTCALCWMPSLSPKLPIALPSLALPSIPMAQAAPAPATVLEQLFRSSTIAANQFTDGFLKEVPLAKVQQIVDQLKQQLGPLQSVQGDRSDFTVQLEKGSIPTKIVLTSDGKIAGLLFGAPTQTVASLEEAIAQFKTLPGQVSVLVQEGKTTRAALNPTQPLAVGSAFKLAVLDQLQTQIQAKRLTWHSVVPLQAQYKSLPSGMLQTWPDGTGLTVESLAALMISQSDNTATDHLIHHVGREKIEAIAPRNQPFLMTRELFQLKSPKNRSLLERYRKGSLSQKRAILAELAKQPLPDVADFADAKPTALDIEWFFSAEELCQLIDRVSNLPLMGINPGIAKAGDWQRVAYKGGSESGVLNLTTKVQSKTGKQYCVVATWNHNQPLDDQRFVSLYSSLFNVLKNNP